MLASSVSEIILFCHQHRIQANHRKFKKTRTAFEQLLAVLILLLLLLLLSRLMLLLYSLHLKNSFHWPLSVGFCLS